jgi:hypothetical protein
MARSKDHDLRPLPIVALKEERHGSTTTLSRGLAQGEIYALYLRAPSCLHRLGVLRRELFEAATTYRAMPDPIARHDHACALFARGAPAHARHDN